MPKKTKKTAKTMTAVKSIEPPKEITVAECLADIRNALVEVCNLASERYLGVIQKLQEVEKRMDSMEVSPRPGAKLMPTMDELVGKLPPSMELKPNGPLSKQTKKVEAEDPLDSI